MGLLGPFPILPEGGDGGIPVGFFRADGLCCHLVANLAELPVSQNTGQEAAQFVELTDIRIGIGSEELENQRPQGEYVGLLINWAAQRVFLRSLEPLGAEPVSARIIDDWGFAEQVDITDGSGICGKIVHEAAIVEIHGHITLLMHMLQEGKQGFDRLQFQAGRQGFEAIPGALEGRILLVSFEVPMVKETLALSPFKHRRIRWG